jgi:hypothetical protein
LSAVPLLFERATPAFFLIACAWGLAVTAALAGWGRLVARAGGLRDRTDTGLAAALGLALSVAVGGVLNLAGLVSRPAVLLFLGTGAVLELVGRLRAPGSGRARVPRLGAVLLLSASALLAALQLAGSVHGTVFTSTEYFAFDPHDDEQAYLAFPLKMLETGGLGSEPFDARRLNLLGGQSFLLTFVLAVLPVRAAHLLDGGVGLLVALLVVAGAARRRKLGEVQRAGLLLLLLALPLMAARGNTTALATGIALLLAAWRLVDEEPGAEAPVPRTALPLALVAAGLTAIKSTFLPAVGLFILFDAAAAWRRDGNRRRAAVAAAALGATFFFLLPWMVSLRLSSGTFLFPLLGRGTQGDLSWNAIPGTRDDSGASLADVPGFLFLGLGTAVPLALLLPFAARRKRGSAAVAFGLMAIATGFVYRFMGDPFLERSIARYTFPVFAAGLLVLVTEGLAGAAGEHVPWRTRASALAALAVVWVVARSAWVTGGTYAQAGRNIAAAVSGRDIARRDTVERTRALFDGVPRGATVLTRVEHAWAIDFPAYRTFLFSMPGLSSPPPGMPFFRGPEPVAEYLLALGIPNVVYEDRGDPGLLLRLTEEDIRYRYPRSRSRWAIRAFHNDFFQSVRELSFTRRRLVDRSRGIALDLTRRALALPVLEVRERLSGVTPDGWTVAGETARVAGLAYERRETDRFLYLARSGFDPDPGAVSVTARSGGFRLPQVRGDAGGLVFDLGSAPRSLEEVSIDTSAREGRFAGSLGGPPLGLDLLGLATLPDPSAAPPEFGDPAPADSGPTIDVAAVRKKKGFFADHNWTDGEGVLSNIHVVPAPGDDAVAVSLLGGPPPDGAAAPGLRLFVNGVELARVAGTQHVHTFRLAPRFPVIRSIRIVSPRFVPADEGQGNDRRRLGVAVESIRIGNASALGR